MGLAVSHVHFSPLYLHTAEHIHHTKQARVNSDTATWTTAAFCKQPLLLLQSTKCVTAGQFVGHVAHHRKAVPQPVEWIGRENAIHCNVRACVFFPASHRRLLCRCELVRL